MRKIDFKNYPNTSTPLSAETFNLLQNNIELTLNTYSTDETRVGTWIDGKPLYRKVLNIGSLPNTSIKTIDTGLSNTNVQYVKIYGIAQADSFVSSIPSARSNFNDGIYMWINSNGQLSIETGRDRSDLLGYAILEYTKTTD